MAKETRKIPINLTEDTAHTVSSDAANAIPGVLDDLEDQRGERAPIDLDMLVEDPIREPATELADIDDLSFTEQSEAGVTQVSTEELDTLRQQVAQANDNYLRTLADLQNFRRRSDEERVRIIRDGNERLIKELLPVLDDFDLALNAARQAESYEQLIGGVSAILRKLQETLAKQGVEPVPALGERFDPDFHEAVMLDEESDQPDETITGELRRGYTMNQRVIRPALVKVSKQG